MIPTTFSTRHWLACAAGFAAAVALIVWPDSGRPTVDITAEMLDVRQAQAEMETLAGPAAAGDPTARKKYLGSLAAAGGSPAEARQIQMQWAGMDQARKAH